jgi:probable rRNA maturation factor
LFHFELFNTPLSIVLSSDILRSIFHEIASRNPIAQNGTINIVFVSDDEMQSLNRQYRDKDATTDVLSFHYFETFDSLEESEIAGEILLSESKILEQAKTYEHSIESETYKLIIHGILHIIGYNHETDEEYEIMHPREIEITNVLRSRYELKIID